MKVGIISDSHDNVPNVEKAVSVFNSEKVGAVVHCGDFVAPFSLIPFKGLECGSFYAVFGNNDGEKTGLAKIADENGWRLEEGPFRFHLGGKNFVAMHKPIHLPQILAEGGADIILSGHDHRMKIQKDGDVLLVNPGEAGGWVTGKSSIVVADTATMEANVIWL